jgi:hypothetical protein
MATSLARLPTKPVTLYSLNVTKGTCWRESRPLSPVKTVGTGHGSVELNVGSMFNYSDLFLLFLHFSAQDIHRKGFCTIGFTENDTAILNHSDSDSNN